MSLNNNVIAVIISKVKINTTVATKEIDTRIWQRCHYLMEIWGREIIMDYNISTLVSSDKYGVISVLTDSKFTFNK